MTELEAAIAALEAEVAEKKAKLKELKKEQRKAIRAANKSTAKQAVKGSSIHGFKVSVPKTVDAESAEEIARAFIEKNAKKIQDTKLFKVNGGDKEKAIQDLSKKINQYYEVAKDEYSQLSGIEIKTRKQALRYILRETTLVLNKKQISAMNLLDQLDKFGKREQFMNMVGYTPKGRSRYDYKKLHWVSDGVITYDNRIRIEFAYNVNGKSTDILLTEYGDKYEETDFDD